MAETGESDENICADALAVDNHLEPANCWHHAEVCVFAIRFFGFSCQATCLAQRWISRAETAIVSPRESNLGMRRPGPHDREDVCRVMAVELVVVNLADGVERDEGGDVEVAGEEEEKLVVCADGIEEVEGLLLCRLGCWGNAGDWDGVGSWGCEGEVLEPSGQL
jgi:hypothetical protein